MSNSAFADTANKLQLEKDETPDLIYSSHVRWNVLLKGRNLNNQQAI